MQKLTSLIEGKAKNGSDYLTLSGVRIQWQPGEKLSRFDLGTGIPTLDTPFDVTIIDDDVPEPIECFEVHFVVQSTGYAYPSAIGRITILDNDLGCYNKSLYLEIIRL